MSLDLVAARLARLVTARLLPGALYIRANAIDVDAAEAACSGLCICSVVGRPDGLFDFAEAGHQAVVIEALAEDGQTIDDLVAWPIGAPARWRLFLGVAGMLGAASATNPFTCAFGAPLPVHRTPLSWLRAKCVGVVPLDPAWTAQFLVSISTIAPVLAAEDDDHAVEIMEARHALVDRQELVVPLPARNKREAVA